MSISTPGSTENSSSNAAPKPGMGAPDIRRSNQFMKRAFGYQTNGAEVAHFLEAFDKGMSPETKKEYKVYPIDDPASLAVSGLIMTRRVLFDNREHVFFFTMLLAATSRVPSSKPDTINNQQIDTFQATSDAMDATMVNAIRQKLAMTFPAKDTQYIDSGAMVIYADIKSDDQQAIQRLLNAAGRAIDGTVAQKFNTEEAFSIGWIPKEVRIQSRVSYSPAQIYDVGGNPLRTDVKVDVISHVNQQGNQRSIHNEERTITSVGGFVTQIFKMPPPPQMHGQILPPMRYFPHLIITSIQSSLDAETLETRLFGLVAGGLLLSKNMNWAGVFLPRHGLDPKEVDTRDIGAIGYEVPLDDANPMKPLGAPVKTKAANFTREMLGDLIRKAFYPNLIISIDAVVLGPDSWLDDTFRQASRNNQQAVSAILQAANNLTNGHFSKMYKGGPIVVNENNLIHLGWYKDKDGSKRDIRDLDYLALQNISAGKDDRPVIDWDKSFEDGTVDPRIRLDARRQILRARYQENLNLTGYAERLTFTASFLMTLADACVAAGLDIRPENQTLDLNNHGQRGYYNVEPYALATTAGQGLFNMGGAAYSQFGQPQNFGTYYAGRW